MSTMTPDLDRQLANELNEEMRSAVMPVTAFVGVEAIFGFSGNIVILIVFIRHYHKCNFKYFVVCLSCVDTISTLTTLPGEIVTQMFWYLYPLPMVCKIKSFFNMFTVCGSAFTLLIISVDRFRKVCRPLKWQITPKAAVTLIFLQLAMSVMAASPVPFLWGTRSYQKLFKGLNTTVTVCEIDEKFKDTDYPLKYTICIQAMLAIVMSAMFVLYLFVCRKLLCIKPEKEKSSPEDINQMPKNSCSTVTVNSSIGDDNSGSCSSANHHSTTDVIDYLRKAGEVKNIEAVSVVSLDSIVLPKSTALTRKTTPITSVPRNKKIRRKTFIMFILTAVFIFTTVLYLILLSFISKGILDSLTQIQKSVYFFFFRLYFINHAINPILYGILDPKFRQILEQIYQSVRNQCCR